MKNSVKCNKNSVGALSVFFSVIVEKNIIYNTLIYVVKCENPFQEKASVLLTSLVALEVC